MSNSSSKIKVCLIGTNSKLQEYFSEKNFFVDSYGRFTSPKIDFTDESFKKCLINQLLPNRYSLFLIMAGWLQSKKISEQKYDDITNSYLINSAGPIIASDLILEHDPNARVFIMGSESGRKGSFDMTYAASKSSLRMYVKTKSLGIKQQLLLISPSTVEDMGMTLRRTDQNRLASYMDSHPKKRFLRMEELADLIINLYYSTIYLTNTEIEINGGKFIN